MKRRVIGYAGGYVAVLIVASLLFAALVPGGASGSEARSELRYGDPVAGLVAGNDVTIDGMAQTLFHRQTLAGTDDESCAIAFPGGASAPAIAQTSTQVVSTTDTGFFNANFLFSPVTNLGAAPIGVGQPGVPAPVTTARFSGKSLLYPEMVVRGNLLGQGDLKKVAWTGFSFPPAQAVGANATVWELARLESQQGVTGLNATDSGLPVILSAHKFNYVSSPDRINNTSIVERLWRNTHQGSLLDFAYEGDTAFPEQIMPLKIPLKLIECGNQSEAIKHGLEMTRPGSLLKRSFWSL